MNTSLISRQPIDEAQQLLRAIDPFLRGNDMMSSTWPSVFRDDVSLTGMDQSLAVDIFEKDGNVVFKAAIPGVAPEDITVKVTGGMLHISAEQQSDDEVDNGDYHRREYRYGKCSRSFRLSEDLDPTKAEAHFENGMLRLTIPRNEKAGPQAITVKVSTP